MKREGQFQASPTFLLPWVSCGSHDAILRAVTVACSSQIKARVHSSLAYLPLLHALIYARTPVPYLHPSITLHPWDDPLWVA